MPTVLMTNITQGSSSLHLAAAFSVNALLMWGREKAGVTCTYYCHEEDRLAKGKTR